MESRKIKDTSITASSAYDASSVGPQHGRLHNAKNGGAWCPRQMVSRDSKEYLEVDLEEEYVVTAVHTQGRFGNGQGQEYAEGYMVDYWRVGMAEGAWKRWRNRVGKELLTGNTDTYSIVEQKLDPPVIASKIRFIPYSDHVRTVCMRVEILGCEWTDKEGLDEGVLQKIDSTNIVENARSTVTGPRCYNRAGRDAYYIRDQFKIFFNTVGATDFQDHHIDTYVQ
nr:unnamed protein product [Callosobruchus chinensis]